MDAGKVDAILRKAEALAGQGLGGDGPLLCEMACHRAMALCCRDDIPEEMEQAVAALAVELSGGGAVKALTRGDVSVSYDTGAITGASALLAPWRRLGTVE